jgi:hypothetical protein
MALIACCGIDCSECPTFRATQSDDSRELERLAAMRRENFGHLEITAESMPCDGCVASGRLSWTGTACPIRTCAAGRGFVSCALCQSLDSCDTLRTVHDHMPQARTALDGLRPQGSAA